MEPMKIFYTYLCTVPVFFVIDMTWLGLVAKDFYATQMGDLLAKNIIWPAAFVFYFAYIFGIIFFAVLPGVEKESLKTVIVNASLFGGLAYATYDLTNLATTAGWPTRLVFVDIIWGIILTTSVAVASYYVALWVR
jgi:uncharacterized membrane protein